MFGKFLEKVRAWLSKWWKVFTYSDETTWGAHFVLVMLGTIVPAALASWLFGLTVGTIVGFAFSELWLLFMSGREVVDYFRHVIAEDPFDDFVRDGIGDIVGPLLVHLLWWVGLLSLIAF